jgi:hypothetical protein
MREIRNATSPGSMKAVLPVWWTLWLLTNLFDNISLRLPTDTIPQYVASSVFDLVTAPVSLASNVVAILLVAGITRLQFARRTAEGSGPPPAQPPAPAIPAIKPTAPRPQ